MKPMPVVSFGPELKLAGYDWIIITGRAEHPTCLTIIDQYATPDDVRGIAGKGIFETEELLTPSV